MNDQCNHAATSEKGEAQCTCNYADGMTVAHTEDCKLIEPTDWQARALAKFPDIGKDPLKLNGDERAAYNSDEEKRKRLSTAVSKQQKEVPDQTALVWRADLDWLLCQHIWRQAGHKSSMAANETLKAELSASKAEAGQLIATLYEIVLVDGPQGTCAKIAEEALSPAEKGGGVASVGNGVRDPNDPRRVLLIHPDYFQEEPPEVTMFPAETDEMGHVKIRWDDGSEDWQEPQFLKEKGGEG